MVLKHSAEVGMAGAGVSFGGGLVLWFGENATAIGAMVVVATFFLTALFFTLNYLLNRKVAKVTIEKMQKLGEIGTQE